MAYLWSKTFHATLFFIIGLLGALFLAGCYQKVSPDNLPSSVDENCYLVTHAVGESCVPRQVEHIVSLGPTSFENLVALELQPIATAGLQFLDPLLFEQLLSVVDLGHNDRPNLERLLQLEPDVIVGLEEYQAFYNQVSQIAPTVLVPFEHSGQWKEMLAFTADALSRADQAEAVMAAYNARL
ncbi:MAG: ABC transporter substrate-binding protein [Cyanobacteria bacterium J06626_6]